MKTIEEMLAALPEKVTKIELNKISGLKVLWHCRVKSGALGYNTTGNTPAEALQNALKDRRVSDERTI